MAISLALLGAILAGAAGVASGVAGNIVNWKAVENTNKTNLDIANQRNLFEAEQAEINRNFQERMATNSYQYAVNDLKAAGLNPALALGSFGAGVPSGSSASGFASQAQAPQLDLSQINNMLGMMANMQLSKIMERVLPNPNSNNAAMLYDSKAEYFNALTNYTNTKNNAFIKPNFRSNIYQGVNSANSESKYYYDGAVHKSDLDPKKKKILMDFYNSIK